MSKKKRKPSLWKGPAEDGITQSLLSRFLVCRERFKVLVVDGLKPADSFQHRLEYGQMWHLCEECFAANKSWKNPLLEYAKSLAVKYRDQQEQVDKYYQLCKIQFPIYIKYWRNHPDVKKRESMWAEETFCIYETLPSGREVKLRGKFDSVDWLPNERGYYLMENKTKGDINSEGLKKQLLFDLQTGFYMTALQHCHKLHAKTLFKRNGPIKGVRYNVIRRPLGGGRHSIRQKKGQTETEFYDEVRGRIESEPEFFFMRWKVEYTEDDLNRFKYQFLWPILEQLWDWWEWYNETEEDAKINKYHWRYPYGVWNPMLEGRASEVDEYLNTGSTAGLEKTKNLFGELELCPR